MKINIPWIIDIACFFGYFLAIYLVTFVAIIPGFNYVFNFVSLLLTKNNEVLVSLDGFSTSISYNKIFQKEIKLNYLKANYQHPDFSKTS